MNYLAFKQKISHRYDTLKQLVRSAKIQMKKVELEVKTLRGFNGMDAVVKLFELPGAMEGRNVYRAQVFQKGKSRCEIAFTTKGWPPVNLIPPTSHLSLWRIWMMNTNELSAITRFRVAMMWAGYGLVILLPYHNDEDYRELLTALNLKELNKQPQTLTSPTGEAFMALDLGEGGDGKCRALLCRSGQFSDYVDLEGLCQVLPDYIHPENRDPFRPEVFLTLSDWDLLELWKAFVNYENDRRLHLVLNTTEELVLNFLFQGIPFQSFYSCAPLISLEPVGD